MIALAETSVCLAGEPSLLLGDRLDLHFQGRQQAVERRHLAPVGVVVRNDAGLQQRACRHQPDRIVGDRLEKDVPDPAPPGECWRGDQPGSKSRDLQRC